MNVPVKQLTFIMMKGFFFFENHLFMKWHAADVRMGLAAEGD